MRAFPILAVALVLAGRAASAQTPDTTAAWRYVPLAVGNEWHTFTSTDNGYWIEYTEGRELVQSERPDAPGHFVTAWTSRTYRQGSPATVSSGTGERFYDAATQRVVGASTPCPLGAPFGAFVTCSVTESYYVSGGHGQTVTVGSQTVTATRKEYAIERNFPGDNDQERYEFAAGIGETRYTRARFGSNVLRVTRTLRYARVSGVVYGAPLSSFPTASDAPPSAAGPLLSVAPNPASGPTTLSYTLAVPGAVRLTVSDALGRVVAVVAEGERGAGLHTASLDARPLAPGLYVVRVSTGGTVTARTLTVVP